MSLLIQPEPEAEDAERSDQSRRVLQIGGREEARVEHRDHRAQHHEQQERRELLLMHSSIDPADAREMMIS